MSPLKSHQSLAPNMHPDFLRCTQETELCLSSSPSSLGLYGGCVIDMGATGATTGDKLMQISRLTYFLSMLIWHTHFFSYCQWPGLHNPFHWVYTQPHIDQKTLPANQNQQQVTGLVHGHLTEMSAQLTFCHNQLEFWTWQAITHTMHPLSKLLLLSPKWFSGAELIWEPLFSQQAYWTMKMAWLNPTDSRFDLFVQHVI